MNVILITDRGQVAKNISLTHIALIVTVSILLMGYVLLKTNPRESIPATIALDDTAIQKILKQQQQEIDLIEKKFNQQLHVYVSKIGQIQGKLDVLENLGSKLVKVSKLNTKEFDFNKVKALGGPEDGASFDINLRLKDLLAELDLHSQQLYAIESIYDESHYRDSVTPRGKPSEKGWVSSYFGNRKDPFTGKNAKHKGIDVAAKDNSKLIVTADGVVTWSGKKSGYGNLIEVNHGNGLMTRYGHCKTIDVNQGDIVKQGDIIGRIGSSGRSTGPHVHYEVIKNGIKINPISYVRKKRT